MLKAIAVLLTLSGLATAQSLGEAARKEKERRKQLEAAGVKSRELTDKDLRSGKGTLANDPQIPAAGEASSAPAQASNAAKEEENARRSEAAWRDRVAKARARLDATRKEYEALSNRVITPGGDDSGWVDEFGRIKIDPMGIRDKIAKAKADWDAAEKALEDLLESARRQGVPPGWLR
jgi:hypothetical protein